MGLAVAQLPQREAIPVLLTTSAATNTPKPSYSPLADVPERRSDLAGISADSQEGSSSGLVAATLFPLRRAVQTLRAAVTQVLANICASTGFDDTSTPLMAASFAKSQQSSRASCTSARESPQELQAIDAKTDQGKPVAFTRTMFALCRTMSQWHLALSTSVSNECASHYQQQQVQSLVMANAKAAPILESPITGTKADQGSSETCYSIPKSRLCPRLFSVTSHLVVLVNSKDVAAAHASTTAVSNAAPVVTSFLKYSVPETEKIEENTTANSETTADAKPESAPTPPLVGGIALARRVPFSCQLLRSATISSP
ncbi:hypothetical protein B5807_02316 [Epicoccum nigrum]|uniref:Uncharacterized protein n=1 Tax=Epicoccum nigrum TaxID=105696 RepID=A0A1Y2M9Y6_EPING|nr:hypothetical protein B5807_02316 [Epicoccum nigrum]